MEISNAFLPISHEYMLCNIAYYGLLFAIAMSLMAALSSILPVEYDSSYSSSYQSTTPNLILGLI